MNPSATAKHRLAASALGILLLVNASAASNPNNAKVDKLFAQWDRKDSAGAAIVVVKDGAVVYQHGYGYANLEHRIPITPQTRFDVASVAKQFTGLSAEVLRGRGIEQLPPILGRLIEATVNDGESRSQVEIALPDQVGQMVPLMVTTSPLLSPQGTLVGAVAIFSDLSRVKELERERRRAERLASMEAIASGMVHEIRNPLVAIKTFTQLLPTRFDDADFRDNFSRVAGREIARVDELLDRFRMLSSASRQRMEHVDITIPLGDTLQLLQPRLEERRVALRQVGESAPRQVLGNASQLEQLFLNLCLNALEAMDSGGELTVRVADLSEGGGSTLLVEVSDTGSGIPDDMIEQIFNPFVTTKDQGTGLGLAICRAITDAHRAILRVRNNIGRPGCTFTVEFPVPVGKPARLTA